MKKLICLLTTFLSLFFMMKPVEATGLKWEISKSKTATQLSKSSGAFTTFEKRKLSF